MPKIKELAQMAVAGARLFRAHRPVIRSLPGNFGGIAVKSSEAKNNMGIGSMINQRFVKSEIWTGKDKSGNVRLELEHDPHADRFSNSGRNMLGGMQVVLHDFAACAVVNGMNRRGAHLTMTTEFLSAVPMDTTKVIEVVAKAIHTTPGHVFIKSDLLADGKLASTASHTIKAKPIAQFDDPPLVD
jgi:hypothetical protein